MNILAMIMFLFVFASILLGGHFFLYFSLVKFLAITSTSIKFWLAGGFFFLSISFILSSILAHYSEGILAKVTYSVFSFWLGMGWNLIMAFIVSWLIVGVAKVMGQDFDYKYLAVFSIIFMIVFSAWGAWNAYNPKIKYVTIEIKNLPAVWKNKKAIQLSDIHLGHIYGKKFLNNIIKKVNSQNPDLVFITGDLFDGMDGELEYLVNPLNNIKAPDGIYFVTGNHETYLGTDKSYAALKNTSVKVLNNEVINAAGMQILGVDYPDRTETENFIDKVNKIESFSSKNPSILLYHNPNVAQDAKNLGIDLQLAGHTHKGQLFPFGLITRLIYGQYHNGLTQEGDFSIYTSSGTGTWGPMMRTSGRSEIVVLNFK